MKNLIAKIISILVIMLMVINSSLILVISTAIDAVQSIIDESKINAIYELNLEKYVNYKVGDTPGLMVQANLKTGIEYQDGQEYVPIEATNVILNTPKVNEEYPERVEIVAKSTKATNGDEKGKDFNCSYNKDNGEIKLITENKADENGNVYSENVADARDEYQINLYYSSNCYNDKNEKRELDFSGKLYIGLKKDDNKTIKTQDISQKFEVTENVSGLISTNVTTSDIYNGYIRSNVKNNTTYRTEYTENLNVQVSYKEIADEVKINTKNLFVNNKDKEIETEEIVYKSTKISKGEVLNELGENGTLQIFDKGGNCLAEINKDSETDENGYVTINYENELTELTFKLSRPEKIGEINVQNVKQIKETMKDTDVTKVETKNQISCINNVKKTEKVVDESTGEEQNVETVKQVEFYNFENSNLADVKEAKSDVELSVDNANWTNNVQNDVTFTANLVTSGPEYELFSNPVIQIKLPQEVEKVILGNISLLYDENLSIKKANVIEKNDYKILNIELNGVQTDYMINSMVGGTNIIIPATIVLKKDISNIDTSIFGTYKNELNNYELKNIDVKITTYNDKTKEITEQVANNEIVVNNKNDTLDNINVNVTTKVGNKILNDGDTIHMGEVIKNVVTITNNSDKECSNIDVVGNVPEGTTYIELDGEFDYGPENEQERHDLYKKFENMKNVSNRIDAIKAKESKTITYLLLINKDNEQKNINNQIDVTSGTEKIYNDSKNFNIKNANLEINLYPAEREYLINDTYARLYEVRIKNTGSTKLTNVNADVCLSKYDIFKSSEGQVETEEYDSENHKVTYSWNEFGENEEKVVYVRTTIDNMDEDKESYDVPLYVTATCSEDDETYISNEITYLLYFDSIDIVQSSSKEGKELKTSEEVEYEFTIKNSGAKSSVVDFEDRLPSGLIALKAKYECFDGDYTGYKKITKEEDLTLRNKGEENSLLFSTFLPQGETITVNITAKADYLDKNLDVINFATVTTNSGNVQRIKTSNIIKNTILAYQKTTLPDTEDGDANEKPDKPNKPQDPDKPGDSDNSGDEVDTKKCSISGTAWIDENKDGIKENNEKRYDGLTVKLFNSETNAIVVNKNGELCKQTTNSNGTYKFDNLEKGKYIVLFEFDDENYEITTYQKENIDKSINSDAVLKSVSIDGREQNVGLTDIIEITGSNVDNIDLGLIKKEKFDFSLKKVITKVNVDENGKKEEKSFNDSQFSKIEIKSKNIGKTNITVEYKFIIKNEGEVTGFLSELIDYIPDGYTINEQSTNTWTKNSKGYIQTTSLSNEEIKPGESKEVTLLLDKKIDNNSMGTITNKAKISKTINAQNEKDVNSDNDISEAKLIISVGTGIKTSLTIILIIVITLILMFIILKYGKFRKISLIILFGITLLVSMNIFGTDKASAMYAVDYGGGERWYISDADLRWHIRKNNNGDFEWQLYHDVNNELWCLTPGRTLCDDGDYFNRGGVYFYAENKSYGASYSKDDILGWIKDLNKRPGSKYNGVAVWSEWWKFSTSVGEYNVTQNTSLSYGESSSKIKVGPFKIKSNVNSTVTLTVKSDGKEISNYEVVDSSNNRIGLDLSANSEKTFYLLVSNSTSSLNVKAKVSGNVPVTENGMQMQDFYKYYCPQEKDKTHQTLMLFEPTVNNTSTEKSKNLEWNITIPRGSLEVKKVDSDTGDGISGAKIKVTGPYGFSSEYTMSSSSLTINNLLYGTYKVEETGAPSGYNLNLQIDKTKTEKIESKDKKSTTIYNKQYGDIKITKYDLDTDKTDLNGMKLSGIKFKIYVMKDGKKMYLKNTSPSKYSYSDFSVNENNKSSAKEFKTDENAQFTVNNLPVYEGKSQIEYYIEEYELPAELQEYYTIKTTADSKKLTNGTTEGVSIKNKQQYIQIKGYVWEDKQDDNKQTVRNDLYESPETRIENITVQLKKKDGTVVDTQTTNSNGEYVFKKVKITELSNYYIEFEYNGLRYQNVTKNLDKDNGSKAVENSNGRTNFNKSFSTISGGNSKGDNETRGYSLNEDGKTTNTLVYTNGTYSSSLVPNTAYTAGSTKNSVIPQEGSTGASIKANTNDAEYSLEKWSKGVTEITNVNLGIAERGQPDLAIVTDLNHMDMTINGYEHRYNFAQRASYINAGLPDKNVNDAYNSVLDGFNVSVKNNQGNYRDVTYSRGIYDSYIAFTKDNSNDEARLKIYLTYKIALKNESSIPFVKVKSLKNYSDAQLDFIDSYIEDGTNTDKKVTWSKVGTTNDSVRNIWQSGEVDAFIEPGKMATVYLTYELNTNSIISLADLQANGGEVYVVGNTTEITAYSSYDSNKNAYAGIDTDSAPENISYGDISTYEDDTDSTPDLHIKRKTPKSISGLVFEDEANLTLTKERIGDGKYEQGNNGVNDVKVELVNFDNGSDYSDANVITLYTLGDGGNVIKTPADTKTTSDGRFEFVGIIPGEYVTKYTYGKKGDMQSKIITKNVTTQDYKSTIITNDKFKQAVQNRSEYWYQDTELENCSSALDDWNRRSAINQNLKYNSYTVKDNYDNNSDAESNHYMIATTGKMTFPIEDKKDQTTNYDYVEPSRIYNIKFGIVERPRQSLEVNKEISYIKLTLQNGTVLVEGDPRTTTMNYVTYPQNGILKVEADNNLIQGSTLQVEYTISVKNKSETDYNTESYYKYGTPGNTPVSLTVNSIVDYMDEGLISPYNESSPDWKLKEGGNIKNSLSQKAYDVIKNRKNILLNEWNKEIRQNETQYLKVEASKIVSASDDNLYENYTEILSSTSDVGRFYGEEINGSWKNYTPGNYDLTNDTHESDDNGYDHISRATLTIVPPTGSDNHVIYYIIGISCLIVIAGGVVIIKKFVL